MAWFQVGTRNTTYTVSWKFQKLLFLLFNLIPFGSYQYTFVVFSIGHRCLDRVQLHLPSWTVFLDAVPEIKRHLSGNCSPARCSSFEHLVLDFISRLAFPSHPTTDSVYFLSKHVCFVGRGRCNPARWIIFGLIESLFCTPTCSVREPKHNIQWRLRR